MTSTPTALKPALPELEALLSRSPAESAQEELRVSRDFWDSDWEVEEMERLEEEFRFDYARSAEQVRAAWGTPVFSGTWEDDGFPEWAICLEMTVWRRGAFLAYVGFEHQDKELPIMVTVGVKRED